MPTVVAVLLAAVFVGGALWLFAFRNRAKELSRRLPILRRYRSDDRPLFRSPADVLWFALWPLILGLVFVVVVVSQLMN